MTGWWKLLGTTALSLPVKQKKPIEKYDIPGGESADRYWEEMISAIEKYSIDEKNGETRSPVEPFAFLIDISECLSGVNTKGFYDHLRKLAEVKGSFLFVFRIPYVENTALNLIEDVLSDVFMLRQLRIPPLSNEQLISYLRQQLTSRKIAFDDDIDETLDKVIAFEKRDGRFVGLKTVDKLVNDIVYRVLLKSENRSDLVLDKELLLDIYSSIKESDTDPEVLLSQLCGMSEVRQRIDEIVTQIKVYKELKREGKKLSAPTMHMRFVGSPGTGKTTVARLVARIFKCRGILSKGYFYEIKARDLCGRYVGETAPKTSAYCRDALGSVLFIDEAYTLFHEELKADYGREAIETLITEMENNRDNLVVIMAGYKKEMDELLTANSGLESRMPYEIEIRNYNRQELIEIFYSMIGSDFTYTDAFDQAFREYIESIPEETLTSETFSNARMIRNLYERVWSKAAYRMESSGSGEIIFQEDDIKRAIADGEFRQLLKYKTKIGF
jgi:SpoVK/Ycf46/Vps4 family AAA+-type ATPase